ncbi:ATP F0F1 synthase synthase [Arthrobacter sp. Sa2BUA2]|uniref:ATP F0F1 synthase synthase n=1 Tax=Arthrobacter pullicola TaxID=2762224 RepID=A0ABR8YGM4_9MICC|nr:ATP F0F1 synthase synthase [Arthrobacter pullicola]MBD8043365.1 ATP F0F1 synthase synthase [Arthrobacter pullicola]
MDHLYARLKRMQRTPYRKIISGERIFDEDVPRPASCREYDPNTILDNDEWFKVSHFSQKQYFLIELADWPTSADFSELSKADFQKINYLIALQEGIFHFQRVRPSAILRRKVIVCGDVARLERPADKIVLTPFPDAVYFPDDDALIFRDLATISSIFRGIDELFTEATDEQVEKFLKHDFLNAEIAVTKVSKPNRKRIALAAQTLEKMSDGERINVFSYMAEYTDTQIPFNKTSNTFHVATDDDLKLLLYGIEQRFYTTPVGEEKRLANSIVKI